MPPFPSSVGYIQNLGKNGWKSNKIYQDMEYLALTMTGYLVIAVSFLAWLYTKPGKKWLENL